MSSRILLDYALDVYERWAAREIVPQTEDAARTLNAMFDRLKEVAPERAMAAFERGLAAGAWRRGYA